MSEQSQQSEKSSGDDDARERVADDALRGMVPIAVELGVKPEAVPDLAKNKGYPIVKDGKNWISSRQMLRAHHRARFKKST